MNYGRDTFVGDLITTILCVLKIALTIFAIATGVIVVGGPSWLLWILIVVGMFFPVVAEIVFIVLKLTGAIAVGWLWLIPLAAADAFIVAELMRSETKSY